MPENHDNEDKTITDALSALGWVEEKDEKQPEKTEKNVQEQLNLFCRRFMYGRPKMGLYL